MVIEKQKYPIFFVTIFWFAMPMGQRRSGIDLQKNIFQIVKKQQQRMHTAADS